MRYRPLAHQPMALSAVSLRLDDRRPRTAPEWASLCVAALECGINCFEVAGRHPALIDGVASALKSVERRLVFLAWRMGPKTMPGQLAAQPFAARSLESLVNAVISRTGLDYLDLVQLDDPGSQDLSPDALAVLKRMKAEGRLRMIGIAGEGEEIDAYISTGAFDLLCTPFNMLSGWRDRRRIKAAGERNMSIIGYDYYPEAMLAVAEAAKPKRTLLSWGKKTTTGHPPSASPRHRCLVMTGERGPRAASPRCIPRACAASPRSPAICSMTRKQARSLRRLSGKTLSGTSGISRQNAAGVASRSFVVRSASVCGGSGLRRGGSAAGTSPASPPRGTRRTLSTSSSTPTATATATRKPTPRSRTLKQSCNRGRQLRSRRSFCWAGRTHCKCRKTGASRPTCGPGERAVSS